MYVHDFCFYINFVHFLMYVGNYSHNGWNK